MKYWKSKLTIILVVQLLLTIVIWGLGRDGTPNEPGPLLSFESSGVSKVELKHGDNILVMKKQNDKWSIPEYHGLMADQQKVNNLVDDLQALSTGELITKTDSSHERLQVKEEKSLARIKLFTGEEECADLIVGTSPTFGKRYVRRPDSQDVYSVDWNFFNVRAEGEQWFDHSLLATGPCRKISLPDFELELIDGKWVSGDQALNQNKVNLLAKSLEKIRVSKVTEKLFGPEVPLQLTDANGSVHTYLFCQAGGKYSVKKNGLELRFEPASGLAKSVLEAKLEDFLDKPSGD